ncbi:MAG: VWA domain-containing protein [Treponema sp.]|jgi:Ca-activated chloride channel family protein|nr:VWA domain-containing protein [Treponema sp.]
MSFDNPRLLFGLFLLIPAAFTGFLHYRKRRAVLDFLSRDAGGRLAANIRLRYFISALSFWLFLACIIIALAQPRGAFRLVSETRRGVDVIFAVDLSRSMDVRDLNSGGPSRLGRAATLVAELINHPWFVNRSRGFGASGIRFGAAIGKGRGTLALPLTEDTEAMDGFLSSLSGSVITGRGTNLESLVDAAAGAFQDAFPSHRRIILLSDGETLEGSLNAAADRAAAADITLVSVGFGSGEGGVVPLGNDALMGEDGRPVVSFPRIDVLRDAAERTGGIYVDGNRGNAAAQLAEYLSSLASSESLPPDRSLSSAALIKGFRRETRPLAHIFIIAALILMGVSKIVEKGGRKNG